MRFDSKSDKYQAVSLAILEMLFESGLTYLNISRISKKSGVSRAWIYQYMGKKREDLVLIAANCCSAFFARSEVLDEPKDIGALEQRLHEGAEFLIQCIGQNPIYIRIYFKYRGTANSIGKAIEKHETTWLRSLSQMFLKILKIPKLQAESLAQNVLMIRMFCGFQLISQRETNPQQQLAKICDLQMLMLNSVLNEK